jgi:hypothetical protein
VSRAEVVWVAFRPQGVSDLDWRQIRADLDEAGHAQTAAILDPDTCRAVRAMFDEPRWFRSTVDMGRHQFGSGLYRYFDYPLPGVVADLRAAFYPHLLPIAQDWAGRLRRPGTWPDSLEAWLERCHTADQRRPTPLLLRYQEGDWNALHQDRYGELVFPLQVVIGLDQPGVDHAGGEFLMLEQRPRAQSRGYAATLEQGHAIVFTTLDRPVPSVRGWRAAPMRHGVSTIRRGSRTTLGLVFHDAL